MSFSHLPPLSLSMELEKPSVSSELTPTRLGFPNEFPYEFDSPDFSPGFTSPGDSTETEDESSDDEEDFLAGLTRRLAPSTHRLPSFTSKPEEKREVQTSSPQSTLSGLGSPILPPQSQTTSFRRDNAYDVISAAAGEVAKLKLVSYNFDSQLPRQQNPNTSPAVKRELLTYNYESHLPSPLLRRQNAAFQTELCIQQQVQQQRLVLDQMWLCSQARMLKSSENLEKLRYLRQNALANATWMPQRVAPRMKRPSAGTGVFLPRNYSTTPTPSDSLKRPVNATTMSQSKVYPQNLDFDESRLNQFDYECMFGRSNLVGRQGNLRAVGGVGCMGQERRLPQDWMY